MSGYEMTVLAHDPFVGADVMAEHGVQAASMEQVLSSSDFVSLHCPLLDETHHLMGERELRQMKSSGNSDQYFTRAGRGRSGAVPGAV